MMTVAEMSRIDRTIEIDAAPDRVWRALTNARELSAWFQVEIEGEIAPGRDVWMTSVHPEHAGQRFRVRFTEMTPPRRLVWEWHPGEVDASRRLLQRAAHHGHLHARAFRTRDAADACRRPASIEISLARRAKVYKDNAQGWAEVLVWLQKYVENAR